MQRREIAHLPMDGSSVTRRTILRGAALGAAALTFSPLTASTAWASAGSGLAAGGPRKGMASIRAADGLSHLVPTVLGARLTVSRGPLPAGTVLTLAYDSRLYRLRPDVRLAKGRSAVALAPVGPRSQPTSPAAELDVVVKEALTAGDYALEAGNLLAGRYPHDLLSSVVPVSMVARDAAGRLLARTVISRSGEVQGVPWGLEVGAAWQRAGWDEHYFALYPALVTLLATGPAQTPAGTSVTVSLDQQVFPALSVVAATDAEGSPIPAETTASASARTATVLWTSLAPLPAGRRLTLRIHVDRRALAGPLARLEPPLITAAGPAGGPPQRLTGVESLTRVDSVHSEETLQLFGSL